jgi:hypothetical protein
VEVECKNCGKKFKIERSLAGRKCFCSKECRSEYKRKHPADYNLFQSGHESYGAKPWLGKHLTEETRRKMRDSQILNVEAIKRLRERNKKQPPFLGRHHTEMSRAKISRSLTGKLPPHSAFRKNHIPWNKNTNGVMRAWNKGRNLSEEAKRKISKTCKRKGLGRPKGVKFSEEHRHKLSLRKLGRKEPVEVKNRRIKRVLKGLMKKPTKLELGVGEVLEKHFPGEWKYVGDGELVVGGKCPDYVHRDGVRVLEVFGSLWHDPDVTFKDKIPFHQTEEGVVEHYAKYGYACVVIWDYELDDEGLVVERVEKLNSVEA